MSRSAARELSNLIEGYGIRGEAGHSLRCGMVIPFARAFGDVVSPDGDGTFAIGYDVRASSPSLAEATSLGLRSGGHHVTHIGACTTPQLEWYVASTGLRGGLMITGGCAPPQHNGLHLYRQGAVPVAAAEVLSALSIDDLNELFAQACNPVLHQDHPLQGYAAFLRRRLEPANFIKLCLDVGNGLAGAEFEAVMAHYRQLRLWRIGFTPDAAFPTRGPDPFAPQARTNVANCIMANGCHLGAALDAGGDRLAVADERGHAVAPDTLGGVLALALHEQHGGLLRVLYDPAVRHGVVRTLQRAGLDLRPQPGGAAATHAPLHGSNAAFYFDAVGHYAFSDFPGTANALLALIVLINHLTRNDEPLSVQAGAVEREHVPQQSTKDA
ncbi:MAG: hypothetical protein P8Z69_04815 [Acidihalobacter sp.]